MAQRTVLAEIDANRRPNCELKSPQKQRILGRFLSGQSYSEIAEDECLPKPTVKTTLRRATQRRSLNNKPRKGRTPKTSDRHEHLILRYAREHPLCTYEDLRRETAFPYSTSTLRRILNKHGILN